MALCISQKKREKIGNMYACIGSLRRNFIVAVHILSAFEFNLQLDGFTTRCICVHMMRQQQKKNSTASNKSEVQGTL